MRCLLLAALVTASAAQQAPLPAMADLRARALEQSRKTAAERERYICREQIRNEELDGKGQIKKTTVIERELFYVNGFQIAQLLSVDGKPLTPGELHRQNDQIAKAIEAASHNQKPRDPGLVINATDILREGKLVNERRVQVAGRPTIVFDVQPDPKAKTSSTEEKLVADMQGTVSIDEATGNLQDVDTRGVANVRVGGGMVANIHKGFALHVLDAPQIVENKQGEVWLIKLAEGTGDARIGMFVHAGMRFHQQTEGCRVYDVNAVQTGDQVKPPAR